MAAAIRKDSANAVGLPVFYAAAQVGVLVRVESGIGSALEAEFARSGQRLTEDDGK